jgi:hypothetical protein
MPDTDPFSSFYKLNAPSANAKEYACCFITMLQRKTRHFHFMYARSRIFGFSQIDYARILFCARLVEVWEGLLRWFVFAHMRRCVKASVPSAGQHFFFGHMPWNGPYDIRFVVVTPLQLIYRATCMFRLTDYQGVLTSQGVRS